LLGWVKGTPASRAPLDLFVGLLQVITPLYLIFTANGNAAQILGASGLFLFGFTYLYVCMSDFFHLDWSGLGWFCLFVVFAAIAYGFFNWRNHTADGYVFAVEWWSWAFLWLLFWLVLALGQWKLTRFTGAVCATQGIITGLIPALILLGQPSWETKGLAIFIAVAGIVLYVIYYFTVKTPPAAVEAQAEVEVAAQPSY
jgi:hypothetical protein